MRVKTSEEIRRAFGTRYPEVDDDEFSIEQSGFVHENPLTAIGVVLISSIVLGTTDVNRLSEFTKYDRAFIHVIAVNMENCRLWRDGKYDGAGWSHGNLFPRDEKEDKDFWDHILIAEGSKWTAEAQLFLIQDAGAVFLQSQSLELIAAEVTLRCGRVLVFKHTPWQRLLEQQANLNRMLAR